MADEAKTTEEDARGEALHRLALLVANSLRVMRGAGKPYEVVSQALDLGMAMAKWVKAGGGEAEHVRKLLEMSDRYEQDEWISAQAMVIRGALQMAASDLLDQATQRQAGRSELFEGIAVLERLRAENRKRFKT